MPLSLVATPIGNPKDITLRALDCLKEADFLICEEPKPARAFLKSIGLAPQMEMCALNEHTTDQELHEIAKRCASSKAALISDCGTPVFCDPGSRLVRLCRSQNQQIEVLPGASSLMSALSYSSERIDHFYFVGFLPANKEKRKSALQDLKKHNETLIFLETPYRMKSFLSDIQCLGPKRKALLCLDLTTEEEVILEGPLEELEKKVSKEKAEFVLILYAKS